MTGARLRSRTQRVAVALALALAMVLGGWALGMPSASADPAVTVYIRDLTPPVASVDANGTVTFINQIADKTVSVGVGPLAVTAVVHTDVTVNVPSGSHVVKPSQAAPAGQPQPTAKDFPPYNQTQQFWTEKFAQSCVTCTISYAYRVDGAQLGQVLNLLPALPAVPTPFVVNTILPLPNLPGVNVPNIPKINVNLPGQLPGVPDGTVPGAGSLTTTTTTTTTTTKQGLNGPVAQYSRNGVDMAPSGSGAVPAFDPSRIGGSAADPAIGNPGLANRSATAPASGPFSPAALLALISVAGVATWLARSILARLVADR
jgi:hypothetical protein